jgi:RNA polymerase sigma-70 factor (ECF subfamily)
MSQILTNADPTNFVSMFERHHRFVLASLSILGVPRVDLEDAMQDVFLVVLQRLADYHERGRARNWLYSICTRIAWSRRRVPRHIHQALDQDIPDVASQRDHILDPCALRLGCELLSSLSSKQRQIFWLYEVEEWSMPEIARNLGCPLQTAYSRLRAARAHILAAVRLGEQRLPCQPSRWHRQCPLRRHRKWPWAHAKHCISMGRARRDRYHRGMRS